MTRRAPRWTGTIAALCVSAALLSSCSGGTSPNASGTTTTSTVPPATTSTGPTSGSPVPSALAGPYWLVEDFTLALLERNGLPAATITKVFNSPRTLLIVRPRGGVPDSLVPLATKVQSFASFATMQAAIQGSTLEPGVKYVLYDNEDWPFTPSNEQAAPFTYAADALALAHAHGLRVIFTPAANLSPKLSPGYTDLQPARVGQEQVLGLSGLEHGGPGRGGLGHGRDPGSAGRGSNQGSPPSSARPSSRRGPPPRPIRCCSASPPPYRGVVPSVRRP